MCFSFTMSVFVGGLHVKQPMYDAVAEIAKGTTWFEMV
jgi:hypothetical protein